MHLSRSATRQRYADALVYNGNGRPKRLPANSLLAAGNAAPRGRRPSDAVNHAINAKPPTAIKDVRARTRRCRWVLRGLDSRFTPCTSRLHRRRGKWTRWLLRPRSGAHPRKMSTSAMNRRIRRATRYNGERISARWNTKGRGYEGRWRAFFENVPESLDESEGWGITGNERVEEKNFSP